MARRIVDALCACIFFLDVHPRGVYQGSADNWGENGCDTIVVDVFVWDIIKRMFESIARQSYLDAIIIRKKCIKMEK